MDSPGSPDNLPSFFCLADAGSNSAFRGGAELHSKVMWPLVRGERQATEPVRIRHTMGSILRDFLWAELYPLVNDRIKELLTASRLTGWSTYPVEVLDKNGHQVAGYHGLSIVGRCQSLTLDKEHSKLIYEENARGRFPYYQGFSIDSWDGSDFMMGADGMTGFILVTDGVRKLFQKTRATNLRLEPASAVRVYAMDQPKFMTSGPAE